MAWFKNITEFVAFSPILSKVFNQKFNDVAASFDKLPAPRLTGNKGFAEPLTVEPGSLPNHCATISQLTGASGALLLLTDTANGETGVVDRASTANVMFNHNASSSGIHGAGANTLLHSGSVIDGGTF